ncbi:hypothetical protein BP5796_05450 [Coleophoma crateriformis]|uniref:Elongator complex protein 4 n=1 Tax=Coleophoma crateriformis TaxID=565419 RepID=A0A3D8S383_9HELO|nr:hypothetical protein BP5796_05450 [Coleophoma crateriformis]
MAFRKRNVGIAQPGSSPSSIEITEKKSIPGVRPSPLDGRPTTSTGTHSLDNLLAGHAGLVLGTSLLIEESGTTDFGGALLRYYAAEGILQGHQIHVFGMNEAWGRELPGLGSAESSRSAKKETAADDKMKIAWRYERLGEFGVGARDRTVAPPSATSSGSAGTFCHDFDLSKRLTLPSTTQMQFVPIITRPNLEFATLDSNKSPFNTFINHIANYLSNSSSNTIHRVIIPTILSPALYPPHASRPEIVLQFFHALRGLLRKYPTQLTVITTLPLTLYPRSSGLTRWMELLSDGVLELSPFPSTSVATKSAPGVTTVQEEPPQGMLNVHRLPIFHERGGGGGEASGFGNDLAFTLSRRKGLVIRPFSLPPVEGDSEAQQGGLESDHGKATKVDIEF